MGVLQKIAGRVVLRHENQINNIALQVNNQQVSQRQLFMFYQTLRNDKRELPRFQDVGFRIFSQTDEDGILMYIFSLIGFTNKMLVDIACGAPYGANTTNLICNWGFTGLLVEGNMANIEATKQFYATHPDTCLCMPKTECLWVTAENINDILRNSGVTGEIDLFSLDVDGVDYWLWKNLTAITPRVVIMEAATYWGKEKSVTVPYSGQFNRFDVHPDYMGASIPAFVKLSREKGYRLVASNRFGYNIVFVRDDICVDVLPEISIEECFHFLPPDLARKREERLRGVMNYEWAEV